jgi:hypothetical protein
LISITQGDPVWAISQATISDLIGLSLNFFFVLPLLNSGTHKSRNFRPHQPKFVYHLLALRECVTLLVCFAGQYSRRSPPRISGDSPRKQPTFLPRLITVLYCTVLAHT